MKIENLGFISPESGIPVLRPLASGGGDFDAYVGADFEEIFDAVDKFDVPVRVLEAKKLQRSKGQFLPLSRLFSDLKCSKLCL